MHSRQSVFWPFVCDVLELTDIYLTKNMLLQKMI
jgi:hypothetical protein